MNIRFFCPPSRLQLLYSPKNILRFSLPGCKRKILFQVFVKFFAGLPASDCKICLA